MLILEPQKHVRFSVLGLWFKSILVICIGTFLWLKILSNVSCIPNPKRVQNEEKEYDVSFSFVCIGIMPKLMVEIACACVVVCVYHGASAALPQQLVS